MSLRLRPPSGVGRPDHPLDSLCAILRLGAGEADLAALRQAMGQGRIDWEATALLANQHLLLPALWPALVEKKLAMSLPPALRRHLSQQAARQGRGRNVLLALEDIHLANAERNAQIRAQALEAIAALNGAGIEPAALKGTRLLLDGDSPFGWARVLRDIDLVVRFGDWPKAEAALAKAGYRRTGADANAASFLCDRGRVEIDLHRRPLSLHEPAELPSYLTEDGFWQRTVAVDRPDGRYRQLPPAERLVHSILHTEIADLNFAAGDWPLRYLYETAVTSRDPTVRIDWSVVNGVAGEGLALPLRAHLHAANRLFDGASGGGPDESSQVRRHFWRCRVIARYPRSVRRVSMLIYKSRQAMAPWYLRRKGYLAASPGREAAPTELWRARLRSLASLLGRHGARLPTLLFGADHDSVPPPRV